MFQESALGHLIPQVVVSLLGTLAAFSDGMSYGWTSPMIPYFLSNESHIPDITIRETEWMETFVLYGAIAGLPFTILSVNYLGRKISMIIAAAVACACWVILLISSTLEWLYIARFFSGMAGDMCFVAAPMYIGEIADTHIRGFLSATIYLMMLLGIVVVYTAGSLCSYETVSIIGIVATAIQVVVFPFMPESPYYSILSNRIDQAKYSLKKFRGPEVDIDKEIDDIQKAIEREKIEKGRPQDLVLNKTNRKALMLMLILNASEQFAGISVILMNVHTILDEAGSVYLQPATAAIIFSVIMLIFATISSLIIDKFGRRKLFMTSSISTSITLFLLAVFFSLKDADYDVEYLSWIPPACIMTYAAVYKIGLGIVPIVVTTEIFPPSIKSIGITFADMVYVVTSVTSISLYSHLYQNYGMHAPFYFYGTASFLTTVVVWFMLPETKGKTMEEIQSMLDGIKPDVKNSISDQCI